MEQNEFDIAAAEAEQDIQKLLKDLDAETVRKLAAWWKRWFMQAGHKRLGRIISKLSV